MHYIIRKQKKTGVQFKMFLSFPLSSRVQHVFDEDAIPRCGVIDEDMGHGPYQFPILNNGTAAHADVK